MKSKLNKRILTKTPEEIKFPTRLFVNLVIKIDPALNKYDNVILFPKEVAKAKEAFAKHGVPDFIKRGNKSK